MDPVIKRKKTPAERRHTRSLTSPWAPGGAKKRARTEQWHQSRHPIQFVLLQQFLKDHDLTLESLHAYLVQHFESEAIFEANECEWPDFDASSSFDRSADPIVILPECEWEEVEIEESKSSAQRTPPPATTSPAVSCCATPEEVVLSASSDTCPSNQDIHLPSEPRARSIRNKIHRNPPRIPHTDFKGDPLARIIQRDLDGLLQTATPRPVIEWQDAIRDSTPDALPFTLFGLQDSSSSISQHHSLPLPLGPEHHRTVSIWGDSGASFFEDADTFPRVKDLFAFGPTLPLSEAVAMLYSMRDPRFFNPEHGVQGGYRWALGTRPGSAGARVRQRFRDDGQWRQLPSSSALSEIIAFTEKRSLPPPVEVDAADIPPTISQGFPTGSLFRLRIAEHPRHTETFWHGSNLYCATSLYMQGPANHEPANGPSGVYCFTDARANKVAYYCHYVLSGSGRAWAAIAQLAIPATKTKKFSTDQRYAQAQDITITALWFHTVSQDQFVAEYIWPCWDPTLEIGSPDE